MFKIFTSASLLSMIIFINLIVSMTSRPATASLDYLRYLKKKTVCEKQLFEIQIGECHYNSTESEHQIKGCAALPPGDEEYLKSAVARFGPIAVGMHANNFYFRFYRSGIFQLENCITSFKGLDHAMLIVGYGTEEGKDFWLVKNSWGKEWGLDGYIKVARNADNNCEIATLAVYPVASYCSSCLSFLPTLCDQLIVEMMNIDSSIRNTHTELILRRLAFIQTSKSLPYIVEFTFTK